MYTNLTNYSSVLSCDPGRRRPRGGSGSAGGRRRARVRSAGVGQTRPSRDVAQYLALPRCEVANARLCLVWSSTQVGDRTNGQRPRRLIRISSALSASRRRAGLRCRTTAMTVTNTGRPYMAIARAGRYRSSIVHRPSTHLAADASPVVRTYVRQLAGNLPCKIGPRSPLIRGMITITEDEAASGRASPVARRMALGGGVPAWPAVPSLRTGA
jgi:hypothetical protein